ncbi:MAG: DNA polymerase IV [Kiritimatiellia bacterium]
MKNAPFMTAEYPRAIAHIDADAFFTSVEQAFTPSLGNRPVVTGKERGIIACASYEAKAFGVKRGITLSDARRLCPGLVVLPSDYETYSLCSKRIFNIIRRYTPRVEEYSIDEAFADLTGVRRLFRCSYEKIALKIQDEIKEELGLTVSVGLSITKSLAKIGSKFRKPSGFTAVPGRYIHILLQKTPLEKVWGFGPSGTALMGKMGLKTAYDFAARPQRWAERYFKKPGKEIWQELRGISVWKVNEEEKTSYATIMKSKTFSPSSTDRSLVYAKLVRNTESAFMKARRYKLRARSLGVVLRRSDFRHDGLEAGLNRATSSTVEILPLLRTLFSRVFAENTEYRATMIVLGGLEDDGSEQRELFEDRLKIESYREITRAVDEINARYGKHTVRSAAGLYLEGAPPDPRSDEPPRRKLKFGDETGRKRIGIPRFEALP